MTQNYCGKCGNAVQPKDLFCRKCGSRLGSKNVVEEHTNSAEPVQKQSSQSIPPIKGLRIIVGNPPDCPNVGKIGLERVRLAADHICSQLESTFPGIIQHFTPVGSPDGTIAFVMDTCLDEGDPKAMEISRSTFSFADNEKELQAFYTRLLEVLDRHGEIGTEASFLRQIAVKDESRIVGQQIYDRFGHNGMSYVCRMFGLLQPSTLLQRCLELAWNGVGTWRG